jgi:hypothetical protein
MVPACRTHGATVSARLHRIERWYEPVARAHVHQRPSHLQQWSTWDRPRRLAVRRKPLAHRRSLLRTRTKLASTTAPSCNCDAAHAWRSVWSWSKRQCVAPRGLTRRRIVTNTGSKTCLPSSVTGTWVYDQEGQDRLAISAFPACPADYASCWPK